MQKLTTVQYRYAFFPGAKPYPAMRVFQDRIDIIDTNVGYVIIVGETVSGVNIDVGRCNFKYHGHPFQSAGTNSIAITVD